MDVINNSCTIKYWLQWIPKTSMNPSGFGVAVSPRGQVSVLGEMDSFGVQVLGLLMRVLTTPVIVSLRYELNPLGPAPTSSLHQL